MSKSIQGTFFLSATALLLYALRQILAPVFFEIYRERYGPPPPSRPKVES